MKLFEVFKGSILQDIFREGRKPSAVHTESSTEAHLLTMMRLRSYENQIIVALKERELAIN